jgi:hypothetical protein
MTAYEPRKMTADGPIMKTAYKPSTMAADALTTNTSDEPTTMTAGMKTANVPTTMTENELKMNIHEVVDPMRDNYEVDCSVLDAFEPIISEAIALATSVNAVNSSTNVDFKATNHDFNDDPTDDPTDDPEWPGWPE